MDEAVDYLRERSPGPINAPDLCQLDLDELFESEFPGQPWTSLTIMTATIENGLGSAAGATFKPGGICAVFHPALAIGAGGTFVLAS